ncbi:MAG: sodium:solute symporter family protein [Spirochaetaceae bacterium]|nr:MAG: sodium:solute symporter family protein [Spirochaetaceae bacterium]
MFFAEPRDTVYNARKRTGGERMESSLLFIFLGAGFFAILVAAGVRARRWVHDASDYLLAGREVGTLLNVFGVAAIGFAGSSVALVPGMAVLYGFWPALLNQLTFSIGGLMAYGVFFAPVIRRCGAQTLPEWLEVRFDRRVRLVVTLGTVIGLTGIMANNVVSIAAVVSGFMNIPPIVAVSIIFTVFLVFSFLGGFWAITFTDFIQLLLGLIAVPLILYLLVSTFGGVQWVTARTPRGWVTGSMGALPVLSPRFPSVLTSILLFACFLVWGNNYYWLRSASCRTEKAARDSFVWAGVLLALFVYAPLLLIGTYVRAAYPETMNEADFFTATTVYGLFLRSVPLFFASFLLLVPLAAGISTATTAHMGATAVVVRDVYQRHLRPGARSEALLLPSRVILLILGLLVWALSFYPGGPLILFAFANAWLGPPALLIVLGIAWRRFTATAAFWSTVLGILVMGVLTLLQLTGIFMIDRYVHVGLVGFAMSLSAALVLTPLSRPRRAGQSRGMERGEGAAGIATDIAACIAAGYRTLAEICDMLGIDAADAHRMVEHLEEEGGVLREAPRGRGYYTFRIHADTEAAVRAAIETARGEERRVLSRIADGYVQSPEGEERIPSLRLSTILARLVREGYCLESGFLRRRLRVTAAGEAFLRDGTP